MCTEKKFYFLQRNSKNEFAIKSIPFFNPEQSKLDATSYVQFNTLESAMLWARSQAMAAEAWGFPLKEIHSWLDDFRIREEIVQKVTYDHKVNITD